MTLSHDKAPLGSPIDITYKFEVAPTRPPFTEENYRVFVGVVDPDEELMWTDDHDPPVPTTQWKPGQKIEYTRTVFVPVYPYVGEASIHMGLYSATTKKRLSLSGQDAGQRAYKVAKLQLQPQTENVFTVFKEGWHGARDRPGQRARSNGSGRGRNRRRSRSRIRRKTACSISMSTIRARRSRTASTSRSRWATRWSTISCCRRPRRSFDKIPLTPAQLGSEDMAELIIEVDKTFVPALLPGRPTRTARSSAFGFSTPTSSRRNSKGTDAFQPCPSPRGGAFLLGLPGYRLACAAPSSCSFRIGPEPVGQERAGRRRLAGAGASSGGEIICERASIARIEPDEVPYPEPAALAPAPILSACAAAAVSLRPSSSTGSAAEQTCLARLVRAVIQVESAYQERARSPKGAMGLMQLMPETARQYAVADPYEPRSNIEGGIKYLKSLLERFELPLALAAYNAGEAAVRRFGGIPPYRETQNYVLNVRRLAGL